MTKTQLLTPERRGAAFRPWKVAHVDLDAPLIGMAADGGVQGVWVVFWSGGVPLGHAELLSTQLPLSAAGVAELAAASTSAAVGDWLFDSGFRAALPQPGWMASDAPGAAPPLGSVLGSSRPLAGVAGRLGGVDERASLEVSVVVCTRDRPDLLPRCLDSLDRLRPRPLEVVVVENGSDAAATRRIAAGRPGVRVVEEPRPGLSVARNAGVRASRGSVVAFTDDDVVVHEQWVGRLMAGFADPGVMVVTGMILPAELETESQLVFQQSEPGFGWGYRRLVFDAAYFERMRGRGVPVWHVGAGANMAMRRELFERVGLFDERLGAGASGCSEDSEWWYRALAAGHTCLYYPAASVYHSHRRDAAGLDRQMYLYARGHVSALLVQYANHGHWGNLRRLLATLPWYYARSLVRRAVRGRHAKREHLLTQVRGAAAGVVYYFRHRRVPAYAPLGPSAAATESMRHG